MLKEVRYPLLEEAQRSPALLSDIAGLERYVAESYDARSFVELLQYADDAGAARFAIQRIGDFLLVANDGRPFTQDDFESLCRSAASSKQRGISIGYRGIGFKSVVGFAKTIYLFSGELEAMFSRELTAREVPEATRVPLVRIPHPVDPYQRRQIADALGQIQQEGFRTVLGPSAVALFRAPAHPLPAVSHGLCVYYHPQRILEPWRGARESALPARPFYVLER